MGEFVGFLFLIFVVAVLILIFVGCSISNDKRDYQKLQFSKKQLEVDNELNTFLQAQVNEIKMSQALTQRLKEYFSLGVQSVDEQKKFQEDIKKLTTNYFPSGIRFMILTPEEFCCLYDSYNHYESRQIGYEDIAESLATLYIPLGTDEYEPVPVAFQAII